MSRQFIRTGRPRNGKPYHYTQCGLDDVYLLNGYERHTTPYGEGTTIEDAEGLHNAIAANIVRNKGHLRGKEIRFLRKLMDLTQADLSVLLGVNVQSVARWEKEQSEVNGAADKVIRLLYLGHRDGNIDVYELIKEMSCLDVKNGVPQYFEETGDGWKTAA